jgi:hypothetical protein
MIYVGEHLPPVRDLYEVEPALIDPRLPVDRAHPSRGGEGVPCWPSYGGISPGERAAYLEWLAGGRSDPGACAAYVFLFFYGLERRLLADARSTLWPLAEAERDALQAEILRLVGLYGRHRSFRGYATELLGAMWMETGACVYERLDPPAEPRAGELPLLLRLGLGQLVRDGRPIPADWALAWALADPERRPPAAAERRRDELRALFHARYAEAFGEGMVPKLEGRELRIHYRPASGTFGGDFLLSAPGVLDMATRRGPVEKIQQILARCAEDLPEERPADQR